MKDLYVIGIDPSGYYKGKTSTIGVSVTKWDYNEKTTTLMSGKRLKQVEFWQLKINSEKDVYDAMDYIHDNFLLKIRKIPNAFVVIEDYIDYGYGHNKYKTNPVSEVIGNLKYLCERLSITTKMQIAAQAKSAFDNKRLKSDIWGFKPFLDSQSHETRHAIDAFRHCALFANNYVKKIVKGNKDLKVLKLGIAD